MKNKVSKITEMLSFADTYGGVKNLGETLYKGNNSEGITVIPYKNCVSGDTEFFNGRCWKPIRDYKQIGNEVTI